MTDEVQQNDPPAGDVPEEEGEGEEEVEVDGEEEEYNVEAIRGKRKNSKTGLLEYLIKWENYPESANTWEPVDNLKCPDLICKFHEQEKAKRKRKNVSNQSLMTKRSKTTPGTSTSQPTDHLILAEDEIENGSTTETLSSTNENSQQQEYVEPVVPKPRGFDRGLPIEEIVGSSTDDDDKLWFFVKWVGSDDFEMIDVNEMEEKAPRDLCAWYKERLYFSIKTGNEKCPPKMTNHEVRTRS